MSSDARQRILGRIRARLGPMRDPRATDVVDRRLREPPAHPVPAGVHPLDESLLDRFRRKLEAVSGTSAVVERLEHVPLAVQTFLSDNGLPSTLLLGTDPRLESLDWGPIELYTHRAAGPGDETSLTPAFAAIAETGTIAAVSAPATPTTHNFVPANQIFVLPEDRIVAGYEELFARLRAAFPEGLPRTVNLITGPSRTADIEQQLVLGAHGPKRLRVVVVGSPTPV